LEVNLCFFTGDALRGSATPYFNTNIGICISEMEVYSRETCVYVREMSVYVRAKQVYISEMDVYVSAKHVYVSAKQVCGSAKRSYCPEMPLYGPAGHKKRPPPLGAAL
jgi:hypothetical protein